MKSQRMNDDMFLPADKKREREAMREKAKRTGRKRERGNEREN